MCDGRVGGGRVPWREDAHVRRDLVKIVGFATWLRVSQRPAQPRGASARRPVEAYRSGKQVGLGINQISYRYMLFAHEKMHSRDSTANRAPAYTKETAARRVLPVRSAQQASVRVFKPTSFQSGIARRRDAIQRLKITLAVSRSIGADVCRWTIFHAPSFRLRVKVRRLSSERNSSPSAATALYFAKA